MGLKLSRLRRRTPQETISTDVPTTSAFKHNQIYKIVSVADKNVLEVVETSSVVSKVLSKKWTNSPAQKFRVLEIRPHHFRVTSLTDATTALAWDFSPADPVLIHNAWEERPNQLWSAEEVVPNSKICVIRSAADRQLAVVNEGADKPARLVLQNRKDKKQYWRLEASY